MDPILAQCRDEEVADFLWRAISKLQAMADRLLARRETSARGERADPYSLPTLGPA